MADSDHQSRSSQDVAAQPGATADLFGEGVGGRQLDPPFPLEGGGYPDIRGISNFRPIDLRMTDLRKMGLSGVLLEAASAIGVDNFMTIWKIFDAEPSLRTARGIEILFRPYKSFLRYQRNRYIEYLNSQGMNSTQIQRSVKDKLGENISQRNVYHIVTKDYYRHKVRALSGDAPKQEHLSLSTEDR